jgi:hypothetical protein
MRRIPVLAVALLATLGAAGARAAPPAPNGITQAPADGCQRNPVGLLSFSSAHWVYVYRDQNLGPQLAEGTVADVDPGVGDLPQAHDWYDFNFDLALDAPYRYLRHTNDPPTGTIHVERESGRSPTAGDPGHQPLYVWAMDHDRMKLWGSWIWDCGHWSGGDVTNPDYWLPGQNEGEQVTGEGTEIHPWFALADTRANPYIPQVGETEADVYITSEGTLAHADEECARKFPPPPGADPATYGPAFTACVSDPSSRHVTVTDRDYSFFVPAPPKPTPGARLRYRVVTAPGHGASPQESVTPRADGIDVTVPFAGFGSTPDDQAFAKAFFVGWDGGLQRLPGRVEVAVKQIHVINSMDHFPPTSFDTSSGFPPGEYGITTDVNGDWEYLNDKVPQLDQVNDGDVIQVNRTFGVNVAEGGPLTVRFYARECDLPKINPCPATPEVSEDNDNPGALRQDFPSIDAAVGDHVVKNSNYEATFSVTKVRDAGLGPPDQAPPAGGPIGPGETGNLPGYGPLPEKTVAEGGPTRASQLGACPDTYAPASRFARQRHHRLGRRFVLRGVTTERDCAGRAAPRQVGVAVARRAGGRCRFVGRTGRLGRPTRCVPTSFLRVRALRRERWRVALRRALPPGPYLAWARASDRAGNVEVPGARPGLRFTVS